MSAAQDRRAPVASLRDGNSRRAASLSANIARAATGGEFLSPRAGRAAAGIARLRRLPLCRLAAGLIFGRQHQDREELPVQQLVEHDIAPATIEATVNYIVDNGEKV